MRTHYSVGQNGGFRILWADEAGLLKIEMLANGPDVQMAIKVEYELIHRIPDDVADTLRFLAAMHKPNRIAFGRMYGPPEHFVAAGAEHDPDSDAEVWLMVADALIHLQDHVSTRLLC